MTTYTIHQAKTQLSRLIAQAEAGEDVVIARGRDPVVRLQPIQSKPRPRFGLMKGKWPDLPDSFFFDALSEEDLRRWEGAEDEDPS